MFLEGFASAPVVATVNATKATSAHVRVRNDMRGAVVPKTQRVTGGQTDGKKEKKSLRELEG